MKTDALIETLSDGVAPVAANAAIRTLALGLGAGALVSALTMMAWLGVRPDLSDAMATGGYWMKFFYTLLFACFGFWTLARLARPGLRVDAQAVLELLPLVAIASMAGMRLGQAPADARMALLMGASHDVCPWRIAALSVPVFIGVFWSMRRLAPTRPALAGAAAGLLAGAAGAFIYAFHCDESAAPFVAVWYTFGIALVGAAGGLLGRWALRW